MAKSWLSPMGMTAPGSPRRLGRVTENERTLSPDVFTEHLVREPADEVVEGSPLTAARTLGHVGDAEVGIWELTQGVVRDTEVDEIFVVISGAGRVEFAGGETLDLSPGIAVRLRDGERTVWTVTETLRKIWVT